MITRHDALAYAREVYAACATVGFADAEVARLKAMLDAGDAVNAGELVAAARLAQSRSVAWVGSDDRER